MENSLFRNYSENSGFFLDKSLMPNLKVVFMNMSSCFENFYASQET